MNHYDNPYPSGEIKRSLSLDTNLSINDISKWFDKERRKIKRAKKSKTSKFLSNLTFFSYLNINLLNDYFDFLFKFILNNLFFTYNVFIFASFLLNKVYNIKKTRL